MIMALRHEQQAQAYAAMSYNPAGEGNIYVPAFNEFLEQNTDLLVGSRFWNFIGDEQTYPELLEVAQEVGAAATALIPAAAQHQT